MHNDHHIHLLPILCGILVLGLLMQPGCGKGRLRVCGEQGCPIGFKCNLETRQCTKDNDSNCVVCANAQSCTGGLQCISGCCVSALPSESTSADDGGVTTDQSVADDNQAGDTTRDQPQAVEPPNDSPRAPDNTTPPDDRPRDTKPQDRPKPPILKCHSGFTSTPKQPKTGEAWKVTFRHATPFVYIGLSVQGPGSPSDSFDGHEKKNNMHHWTFSIKGQGVGIHRLTFTADKGTKAIASCQIEVHKGSGTGPGPCTPNCKGVLCGGDDGCGGKCAGKHREQHGGVSDCRLAGDCGCGKEDNGNMVCGGDGKCIVRCSCDCLPPQSVDPARLKGMNRADACRMLFKASNDPTVWDYKNNKPLCPLDRDPQGAERCTKCPPCHRDHPTACSWKAWCTCRDPRWISEYRTKCCANGHCF